MQKRLILQLKQNRINEANFNFIFFITFAYILIFFAGFRPIGFDFDSQKYLNLIVEDYQLLEPTFLLIRYFAELFTNDKEVIVRIIFLVYAFLNMLILSIAINKFVKFNLISLLVYTFTAYAMITITQMRFGVAVAFFLWAIYDLSNSNSRGFIFKTLIATSFHYSLAIALPLVFLSPSSFNKRFYIMLPILFVLSILLKDYFLTFLLSNINLLPDYIGIKLKAYAFSEKYRTTSMPLINLLSLLIISIYYLSLLTIKKIDNERLKIVIKIFAWGLAFYFLLSFTEVFAKRIMFTLATLMIVLIPFIVKNFKQKLLFLFFLFIYVFLYFINLTVNNELLDYELYFSKGIT